MNVNPESYAESRVEECRLTPTRKPMKAFRNESPRYDSDSNTSLFGVYESGFA